MSEETRPRKRAPAAAASRGAAADEPLIPELQGYREAFRSARQEAQVLTGDLSEAQFNWQPGPERWSIAQCLNHLNVVGGLLLPRLEKAVQQAHAEGRLSQGPFRYGWIDRYFVRSMQPSPRRNVKAPRIYLPTSDLRFEVVVPGFMELQDQFIACVEAASGVDLRRVKIASPVTRLLRVSLGAWFGAVIAHEQRHLLQAQQVRAADGFPR